MKVYLEKSIPHKIEDQIKELGYEVTRDATNALDEIGFVVGSQQLIPLPWEQLINVKAVLLKSVGIDYLPLDILERNHVILTNNRGAYATPIGEFIIYNMLQIAKQNGFFYDNQREHQWKFSNKLEGLSGKSVLFLGTGTIAIEAAKRLESFEMDIYGYNTSGKRVAPFQRIITESSLKKELANMDYLVFCLPSTKDTEYFFNEKMLQHIKPGVKIINISRGNVIDENALIRGLEEKLVGGAALDVFEEEPLDKNSPLWEMDQVYLTPHNSFYSDGNQERQFLTILENLKRYKEGKEFINIVNYRKGY